MSYPASWPKWPSGTAVDLDQAVKGKPETDAAGLVGKITACSDGSLSVRVKSADHERYYLLSMLNRVLPILLILLASSCASTPTVRQQNKAFYKGRSDMRDALSRKEYSGSLEESYLWGAAAELIESLGLRPAVRGRDF